MQVTRAAVRVPALRITLVMLSVTALVSGCHVPGTGGSDSVSGSGSITVAYIPGIENAPLSVGVKDGLFQQHGLTVTLKTEPSVTDELAALADGQAQIAVGDYTDFLYEQANGKTPLRLIADGYDAASNSVAILTLPNSSINSPDQLTTVGTPLADEVPQDTKPGAGTIPYNIETLAAQEVLQNEGVSPSSVSWMQEAPADIISALRNGTVSAILVTEPYITEAEQQLGAVELVDASSGVASGLPLSGYFSAASYAAKNPTNVQAFQQALSQAQADCAQRGPVQAVLPQLTSMSTQNAALITLGTYPTSLSLSQVDRVATLMYESGMTNTTVSLNTMASG